MKVFYLDCDYWQSSGSYVVVCFRLMNLTIAGLMLVLMTACGICAPQTLRNE